MMRMGRPPLKDSLPEYRTFHSRNLLYIYKIAQICGKGNLYGGSVPAEQL